MKNTNVSVVVTYSKDSGLGLKTTREFTLPSGGLHLNYVLSEVLIEFEDIDHTPEVTGVTIELKEGS